MNVKQLREMLEDFPEDQEVVFLHPAHDYWNTELASSVDFLESGYIKYDTYHNKNVVVDSDGEDIDGDDIHYVVIIR
jgi:hypothetical protein